MNSGIKNLLGVAIIIVLLIFGLATWQFVGFYSKSIQPSSFRSFTVNGEGQITAIPDIAQFSFSVLTEGDKNIAKLQKDNVEKINNAIAFVKSQGIEAKDIKTQNYNLTPRYQYYSCPKDGGACPPTEIIGYKINQSVSVKIRNFDKIGDILSGVVNKGANSVSQLSFTIDDPTKVEGDARTEAIQKAKEKAQTVARAGGFSLGRLLSIEEGNYYPRYYDYAKTASLGMGGAESAPAPTIEPGSQDITITVTLKYEIQ